jgi:BRCA1-associated protein
MFSLLIESVELPVPDAFAALPTADADEVGTSSSAAAGGAAASNPISPRSSNPLPSTTSATTPLELPGVTPAASARNPKIHHTRGVLHLYRSSPSLPASSYASAVAVAATPSSSSSGPTAPPLQCDSLLPVTIPPRFLTIFLVSPLLISCFLQSWRGTRLLVLAVPTRVSPEDFVRFCGPYVEHASEIRVIR